MSWSRDYCLRKERGEVGKEEEVEVVFLSPPWGGIDYKSLGDNSEEESSSTMNKKLSYSLSSLSPLPGDQLFSLAKKMTPHIALYLPRNTDIEQIASLCSSTTGGQEEEERVEVEEAWMGKKLKAITCYYGDLATKPRSFA